MKRGQKQTTMLRAHRMIDQETQAPLFLHRNQCLICDQMGWEGGKPPDLYWDHYGIPGVAQTDLQRLRYRAADLILLKRCLFDAPPVA